MNPDAINLWYAALQMILGGRPSDVALRWIDDAIVDDARLKPWIEHRTGFLENDPDGDSSAIRHLLGAGFDEKIRDRLVVAGVVQTVCHPSPFILADVYRNMAILAFDPRKLRKFAAARRASRDLVLQH